MVASRNLVLTTCAGVLAAGAVGAITYRLWIDLPAAPAPSASSRAGAALQGAPRPGSTSPPTHRSSVAAKTPAPAAAPSTPPTFDIVRVEPSGETVVAGRAAPHAKVSLVDKGLVVAQAEADASGQFAILPPPLAAGDHQLSLRMKAGGQDVPSRQSVTVAVPGRKGGRVIVALAAPGEPTTVLSDEAASPQQGKARPASGEPKGAAPARTAAIPRGDGRGAPPDKSQVFIRTVEVGQDGGFFASGTAAPGAKLRLYVNNSAVTSVTADANGRWSLRVGHGLRPGSYAVRADQIDPANGAVLSRAEAPFEFGGFSAGGAGKLAAATSRAPPSSTASVAEGRSPAPRVQAGKSEDATSEVTQSATTPAQTPSAANASLEDLPVVRVVRGDNLWRISRSIFGHGIRYTLIYEANASQIRDRNLIYPGQIFVVPKS